MAYITDQVKRAQAAYSACGFKRGEFAAQTDRIYRGRRNGYAMYDYGDLLSWVRNATKEKAEQATKMIHHGYNVNITVYKDKVAHIGIRETGQESGIGEVWVTYADKTDENGINIRKRVI